MAGGKVVALVAAGAAGPAPAHKEEPMDERRMGFDRFPIWVHVADAGQARAIVGFLKDELCKAGFQCDSDLQTDPHKGLKIEAFFEVFLRAGEKRAPEHAGIVTLYSDGEGRFAIKMNPSYPEACVDFRKAISGALGRQISASPGGCPANLDIVIRQQNDYEAHVAGEGGDPKTS